MDDEPFWTLPRTISALIVAGYTLLAYGFRGGEAALRLFLFCMLPVMCIWFPEFMGYYRGSGLTWPRTITAPSPPIVIFILGWVLLAMPVVVVILYYACY